MQSVQPTPLFVARRQPEITALNGMGKKSRAYRDATARNNAFIAQRRCNARELLRSDTSEVKTRSVRGVGGGVGVGAGAVTLDVTVASGIDALGELATWAVATN